MNMDEKVGNKRFTVYDSEADTVLELINELGSITNDVCDSLDNKTDLFGDHKGSWQGLNRPTLSEEGMRATVEDIIDNKIPSIESSLDNMEKQINDIVIDVNNFGFVGNGEYDDSIAVNNAIEYANSLIQNRKNSIDSFGGLIKIQLPAKRIYVKNTININNAITLEGHGTSTSIVVNAPLDYIIRYEKINGVTFTTNEETQIEGGAIKNLRFSCSRKFNLTSAIYMYGVDHLTIDNVYWYGVKGSCLQMKGVRECTFNNIYTRFCGDINKPLFEIIKNESGDTSNLNIGNNWSIVFPFWEVISFDEGNFISINNVLVHGLFEGVVNSLEGYFGINNYLSYPFDYVVMKNGASCTITNFEGVYCPHDRGYFVCDNNSTLYLSNIVMNSHYKTIQTHTSLHYFIKSDNASKVYLSGYIMPKQASQNGNVLITQNGGEVIGKITDINNAGWINGNNIEKIYSQELMLCSDINKAFKIKGRKVQCSEIDTTHYIRSLYEFRLPTDGEEKPLLKMGVYQYDVNKPMVSIPNDTLFKLPIMDDSNAPNVTGFMWISKNDGGKLKFKIDSYIKTVQTD